MRDHDEHIEMEKLAGEIRKLGTPYVSPEPDDRYWAGLRVGIMERIAEKEERGVAGWLDRAREFVLAHVLGTSLAGAALAVAIAMVIANPFGQPSPTPQVASRNTPSQVV